MSANVTGVGAKFIIFDKNGQYPNGYVITEFSDDSDPIDNPNKTIVQYANALNGTLLYWYKTSPNEINISVYADSDGDIYLTSLLQANDPQKNKKIINSELDAQLIYNNGKVVFMNNGKLVEGSYIGGISSDGKKKTKTFKFIFEEIK